MDGKLLKRVQGIEEFVDLEVASGIYLLKLTSDNRSVIKKVIVE